MTVLNYCEVGFGLLDDASRPIYHVNFPVMSLAFKILIRLAASNFIGIVSRYVLIYVASIATGVLFNIFMKRPLGRVVSGK